MSAREVVIIGGGVSGLAVAHALSQREDAPQVTVLEASDRLGGKIVANTVAGRSIDAGPDALLVRDPAVRTLLDALGLTPSITAPKARGSFIWTRGRLRALPPATLFGVPERLRPLLASGLISWPGLLRAAADLVLPRTRIADPDPSVGALLRPRLGREVFERLVDPLIGGIYAGRADLLSARSSVPEVAAILAPARSVYRTMRARAAKRPSASGAPAPVLISFPGGMPRIIVALRSGVRGDIELGAEVVRIKQREDGRYRIRTADGRKFKADEVVVAAPAHAAAAMLRRLDAELADALADIPYASVATVTLAYPTAALRTSLRGTGFLVPAVEGRFIVGCTWMDEKWGRDVLIASGTDEPADDALRYIRVSVGRHGDDRWTTMDDDAIVATVHAELAEAMGITAAPQVSRVQRWPAAMPQYTVGHAERLARIERRIDTLPGLHLLGAGYRGVGVASCLTSAQAIASRIGTDA